jgi:UDP-glucose 4-epimerase
VRELLDWGYEVVGLDNYSKYGPVSPTYDGHVRYRLVRSDARDANHVCVLLRDCHHFIAATP